MDRRAFLLGTASALIGRAATSRPSEILYNARIYAVPEGAGFGKIVAAGGNKEIRALSGPYTRRTDLAGKTVLPGFVDAHTHVAFFGIDHLRSVDCSLASIADIQKAIGERASRTPKGE